KETDCQTDAQGDNINGTQIALCDNDNNPCVTFSYDATKNSVSVTLADEGTSTVCDGVIGDPSIKALAAGEQHLGGSGIKR
ncbi:MAG: hypothetical protein GXO02_04650, partial [Epsilonproteobacteria bacterium]|nr:hypothetical protein [Campylobacterota bacterium]